MKLSDLMNFVSDPPVRLVERSTEVLIEIDGETWPIDQMVIRATGDWTKDRRAGIVVIVVDKGEKSPGEEPDETKKDEPYIPENAKTYTKTRPSIQPIDRPSQK